MARIYAGELTKIDQGIVERLRERLPDDYTVLAEVNIGRNVDLAVIRPNGNSPALLIAAELKHTSRALKGQTDGVWSELADNGDWVEIEPSSSRDINYYFQAVHAADALKGWLWRNQRLYRDDAGAIGEAHFSAWPDLLLLSGTPVVHRLPMAPANRFGMWFFELDTWIDHVRGWMPRKGVALHQAEIDRLIGAMGLIELPQVDGPTPVSSLKPVPDVPGNDLASVVRDLRERVLVLEATVSRTRPAPALTEVARAS